MGKQLKSKSAANNSAIKKEDISKSAMDAVVNSIVVLFFGGLAALGIFISSLPQRCNLIFTVMIVVLASAAIHILREYTKMKVAVMFIMIVSVFLYYVLFDRVFAPLCGVISTTPTVTIAPTSTLTTLTPTASATPTPSPTVTPDTLLTVTLRDHWQPSNTQIQSGQQLVLRNESERPCTLQFGGAESVSGGGNLGTVLRPGESRTVMVRKVGELIVSCRENPQETAKVEVVPGPPESGPERATKTPTKEVVPPFKVPTTTPEPTVTNTTPDNPEPEPEPGDPVATPPSATDGRCQGLPSDPPSCQKKP